MQVLHTLTYFLEQSELALSLQRTRSRGDPTCDRSGVGLQPLHDVTALFNHLATADEEAAAFVVHLRLMFEQFDADSSGMIDACVRVCVCVRVCACAFVCVCVCVNH